MAKTVARSSDRPAHDPAAVYFPEALELLRRVQHDSQLSDDEILLLAVTAGQAALASYWEPGERFAEHTLDLIAQQLDRDTLARAVARKLHNVLQAGQQAPELLPDRVTTKHTGP
jgi:hypothetical protein